MKEANEHLGLLMRGAVSPGFVPYAPLSPVTIKLTPHRKGGPLINRGDMLASVEGHGQGHVEYISDTTAVTGTAHEKKGKPIAAWHQGGTKRMPARPFIGFDDHLIDSLMELVADDLIDSIDLL